MKTRLRAAGIAAKPENDAFLIRLDGINRSATHQPKCEKDND